MTGNGVAPTPAHTATRVLIADDHPTIHVGLATLIRAGKPGWEICPAAADGREAIVCATELRPHLVIMDYTMPHVNGLEATGEIHRALPGIEVLIFTGTQSRHALAAAFHSQARGCLLKSEGPEALLPALESVRHRHRFRSHGITAVCDDIARTSGKLATLTDRERETACLLAEAKTTKEIATDLGVSEKTIETHRANVFRKLRVRSVAELVRYALRVGLVEF
ncbi:MAG: response regulator transcription factor [Verrucomicrobiota bacterium]|nr:response regulator transcription factor [Verrucomicrobiota bacterium]